LSIYGGRAAGIIELASTDPKYQTTINNDAEHLVAEMVFVIREEFAETLSDIVFRRTMIGFNADQGRPLYGAIATIASAEFNWTDDEVEAELRSLLDYADSLRIQQ
jgi:glycerol-3-phosphate dehydrogenase